MSDYAKIIIKYSRGRTAALDELIGRVERQGEESQKAARNLTAIKALQDEAISKFIEAESLLKQALHRTGEGLDLGNVAQEETLELQSRIMFLVEGYAGLFDMSAKQREDLAHLELFARNIEIYLRSDVDTARVWLNLVELHILKAALGQLDEARQAEIKEAVSEVVK